MGNHYSNLAVRGAAAEQVRDVLAAERVHALVTPDLDGAVVAYEEQSDAGDLDLLTHLGKQVSGRTGGVAMTSMNLDDDGLILGVFAGGRDVTGYVNPGALMQGVPASMVSWVPAWTAWQMCRVFRRTVHVPYAWFVLQRPHLFEVGRHRALAGVLGLPVPAVLLGYRYVQNGELEPFVPRERLLET